MNKTTTFFPSKYPVIAVAMNQVSDINLAIAVAKAGGFPSISIFNYIVAKQVVNWPGFERDLAKFQDEVGNNNIAVSIDTNFMIADTPKMIEIVDKFKISHIEIIGIEKHLRHSELRQNINRCCNSLVKNGTRIFIKAVRYPTDIDDFISPSRILFNAIGIKSSKGAGRIDETHGLSLVELVKQIKTNYPEYPIIAVGGVGSNKDVSELLASGASAIGIGTLFAASAESPISMEAKIKMIKVTNSQLTNIIADTVTKQRALVFKKYAGSDNGNNTFSLRSGIQTGKEGHVFAGAGIDHINEILPVKDIIERLFDGVSLPN